MLYDAVEEPGSHSTDELLAAYAAELRAVVERVGVEAVVGESGVDEATVRKLDTDDVAEVTLADAAAVLAAGDESRDAEAIAYEVRDHLLMGMTTAVLDVDTIAANVDLDFDGKEVQQALEGRMPVTLAQLAALQRFIDGRKR
jgi:tartrate dehydratase beta subunit/fumarate hydratase class I family protein